MTCTHRIANTPGGLLCERTEPHDTGHVYRSSNGSEVDDTHPEGGHG